MERYQAREQRADGAHRRHHNPCMGAPLGQVGVMQRHEVTNVVRDDDASVGRTGLEQRGIRPTLLPEIVDVVGINAPCPQLRRQGGIDVFIEEED